MDFFFSSRRRHTRCSRDWSSDVCSSDLYRRPRLTCVITGIRFCKLMLMVLPKVTCPVCQAETKESKMIPEAMADARMCYRCAYYLAPEKGGTDHGLFMVPIEG